jgi:hypothetical protein
MPRLPECDSVVAMLVDWVSACQLVDLDPLRRAAIRAAPLNPISIPSPEPTANAAMSQPMSVAHINPLCGTLFHAHGLAIRHPTATRMARPSHQGVVGQFEICPVHQS